jgi:hypothetical protein
VATRLNLAAGSPASILPAASAADTFLAGVPPGSNPGGANKDRAESLKDQLESYNEAECGDDD